MAIDENAIINSVRNDFLNLVLVKIENNKLNENIHQKLLKFSCPWCLEYM